MCVATAIKVILGLCVLETHLGVIRGQSDTIELESEEEELSPCDRSPKITTRSRILDLATVISNINKKNDVLNIEYGTDFEIRCWGVNATTLCLTKDGVKLETELNTDAGIKWSTIPNEATAKYVCTDTENACKVSLTVRVSPAFIATLPNSNWCDGQRVMPYGNNITLQCSGFDASQLVITKDGKEFLTEKVNETTIQWSGMPDIQRSLYVCTDSVTKFDRRKGITVEPNIYVQLRNETIKDIFDTKGEHFYRLNYGSIIQVFCSGSRPVRLIGEGKEEIEMEHINETAVKSLMTILHKGSETFTCVDSEFPEYKSKVRVVVTPRIVVLSPNIRRVRGEYVMKYGDPLEVLCIGPDAERLKLSHGLRTTPLVTIKDNTLNVDLVNKTTIKWVANKTELHKIYDYDRYFCSMPEERSSVVVKVDTLPETTDFRCISHDWQYLNCSWKSTRFSSNFSLFSTANGGYDRICSKIRSDGEDTRFCIWYNDDYPSYSKTKELSFLMQTCNDIGCNNQTFRIEHRSILKVSPPQDLEVYSASSNEVVLRFRGTRGRRGTYSCNYKVDYSYSDAGPIEVEESRVYCGRWCEIMVELPCPGQDYQVRVYRRLQEAVGDEFWSEPSSVRVHTDANDIDVPVSGCPEVQKPKNSCL